MRDFWEKNGKSVIIPTVVLLVICLVIPFALSLTNAVTKDKIADLEKEKRETAMSGLIEADAYEQKTYQDDFTYTVAIKDGSVVGYIFETSKKGYGDQVSVMTAVNPDGTVKAIEILDVSGETPGLGQNAKKEEFYSQYAGKGADVDLVKNGADEKKNQVDAVTGATITSRAVTGAVNEALEQFQKVRSVEENG